jgi:hypothetical protein
MTLYISMDSLDEEVVEQQKAYTEMDLLCE